MVDLVLFLLPATVHDKAATQTNATATEP